MSSVTRRRYHPVWAGDSDPAATPRRESKGWAPRLRGGDGVWEGPDYLDLSPLHGNNAPASIRSMHPLRARTSSAQSAPRGAATDANPPRSGPDLPFKRALRSGGIAMSFETRFRLALATSEDLPGVHTDDVHRADSLRRLGV